MAAAQRSRFVSFAWVALAYVAAGAAALLAARLAAGARLWVVLALADLAATIVVFGFSRAFDNSSVYDPYWSVAPMVIAPALALSPAGAAAPALRRALVVALVLAWGARLTYNWAHGWQGLQQEDWRYVDLRRTTGRAYWLVSLVGLHLMPTLSVYLGCLALLPALAAGGRSPGPLDAGAALLAAGALAMEAVADEQLRTFRRARPAAGETLAAGLWALCRHPNYLGEIGFWWGVFLFALAANPRAWWAVVGPLWITALFVFVSVPLMDRRALARRPGYAAHMARLPALLPRPFGRARRET
ncbi:MAG TPA: DUF1295 domain-containing protein [Myxococcota bacterium]|jgi:steroid 5-alpha reductase family enzyme|nr:DUF1295 domain-containing protein [Myxococcota bacterium]